MTTKKQTTPIGYGSPPVHAQFEKGQSGNPAGRPRGSKKSRPTAKELLPLAKLFDEPVPVIKNGKTCTTSLITALGHVLIKKELEGNTKALRTRERFAKRLAQIRCEEREVAERPQGGLLIVPTAPRTIQEWTRQYGDKARGTCYTQETHKAWVEAMKEHGRYAHDVP